MGWRHVIGLGAPASKRMASLMTRQNIANMAAWQWEHTKLWNNTPFIQYEMLWIYVCICVYIYTDTHTYIYIQTLQTQLHTFIVMCVYIYGRYFQFRYLKWPLIWIPLGLVQIHRFPCSVLEASGRHLGNGARETRDSLKDGELVHWRDERQI
jgi:hypothetical protein